jgi:cytochrome subunit of sulfide dehydrogenase
MRAEALLPPPPEPSPIKGEGPCTTPSQPATGESLRGDERVLAMQLICVTLLIAGLLPPSAAATESAMLRGRALAHACAACHGPDGRSQGAIPSIDHLPAEDFIAALKTFRADARKGTVMNRIAKGVDDAEISAMAAYFAGRQGR